MHVSIFVYGSRNFSEAPLIARIYETCFKGSELLWENSATHKLELQALVAPRGDMILAICFLGSEYFAQRFYWPFDKKKTKFFRLFLYTKNDIFGQKMGLLL